MSVAAFSVWAAGVPAASSPDLTSVVRSDPHTGKLVRTVSVRNPRALAAAVDRVAAENSLPPQLVHSVIQVESAYNPYAVSPKGARGLMQLEPETARRFGVSDAFNPLENLQGGAKYLKYLLDRYHGDYPRALAAYNAGEKSVEHYRGVPPYPETQKYVVEVGKRFQPVGHGPAEQKAQPKPPAPASEEGNHIQEIRLPDGSVRYVSRQPL